MSELPYIKEVDGQLVLVDPVGFSVMQAVAKHNCKNTFKLNADRVLHFANRIVARGLSATDMVIIILNVDDVHGGPIAELLMPGNNWDDYRARGEIPFARGLAERNDIEEIVATFDSEAAEKLRAVPGVAVVVVDHGTAEIFLPSEVDHAA